MIIVRDKMHIAIIGCGWAGQRHATAFRQCGTTIRWAVDTNIARAEKIANEATHTSTDYRQALADPAVEAVSLCLPHNLHAPVAVEAAQAGKHVLVEKPLAATLAEADQMIAAADAGGVVLMVAEDVRFEPLFHKIRHLLDEGVIGKPALIQRTRECYLRQSFLRDRRWFLDAQAAAGGIMMSGGIHDFEMMRMIIGEVESVYALRAPQRFLEMEGDDTSVALIRFRDGIVGTLVESFIMKSLTTASGPEVHTLRIDGTLGSLCVDGGRMICIFSERSDWLLGERLVQHEIYVPPEDTFRIQAEHFLHCIRTGAEPITSGRSQRKPLEIVLAAYESMHTGLAVRIS